MENESPSREAEHKVPTPATGFSKKTVPGYFHADQPSSKDCHPPQQIFLNINFQPPTAGPCGLETATEFWDKTSISALPM